MRTISPPDSIRFTELAGWLRQRACNPDLVPEHQALMRVRASGFIPAAFYGGNGQVRWIHESMLSAGRRGLADPGRASSTTVCGTLARSPWADSRQSYNHRRAARRSFACGRVRRPRIIGCFAPAGPAPGSLREV